uniref:Neuroblastoma breakpoint family member 6-like protein n=2 Tax=Sus scrofa TaxID=9823 RepID=A0A287B6K2_PIG
MGFHNQELQRQLAQSKQDFRDLREKFLVSEATAYSLANQLQKYQCEGHRDIIESVLGEKLEFKVVKLAERLAEDPAELDVLIHAQARELTQLRQKVKEGRDDCVLLVQHLTDLLTHKDLDKDQGQGLREQLTEGHRLAERLARKFSPGKGATDPDCTGQLHGPQESSHLTRHVLGICRLCLQTMVFLGPELNPCHSSDNSRSLTHWAPREQLTRNVF